MRALVVGGSGTLGRAVCAALAEKGAQIALTYLINETPATEIAARIGARALRLDLTEVAAIDRVVDEAAAALGGLDALAICSGIGVTDGSRSPRAAVSLNEIDEAAWDRMLAVNAKGPFFVCRAAARHLKKAGGGNIVLTGSIDGIKPAPSPIHYAATKGALQGMALSMMKELGAANIRVNVVAPGVMETGLSRTISDELRAQYVKHCGLGRTARPEEVARVIAWLALENSYVTGQTLVLDGAL
jgi:NAD(P)-dependent dehydrogenase (short-subunit alcohol dehydrogenase family)